MTKVIFPDISKKLDEDELPQNYFVLSWATYIFSKFFGLILVVKNNFREFTPSPQNHMFHLSL